MSLFVVVQILFLQLCEAVAAKLERDARREEEANSQTLPSARKGGLGLADA